MKMNLREVCGAMLCGTLHPFPYALLKTPQIRLSDEQCDLILQYAHGDCHLWTITLLEECADLDVVVFLHDHNIIHSAAGCLSSNLFFDANGIQTLEAIQCYWKKITHSKPEVKKVNLEKMYGLISPEPEEISDTRKDIVFWLDTYELTSTPYPQAAGY
ncbi:hypothetical protein [Pedobacter sp.]|uniref:hypothetical protein n=1 Tax=Pedobacter sp. TaxID=1411316 RepID=UPI003D7F29E5